MASSQPERREPRDAIEICRPITLQLLSDAGEALSPWLPADILDVSVGGLCLLISEDPALELRQGMPLRLDVTSQPAFGQAQISGQLRWCLRSGLVVTLGLVFNEPLPALPELES
ncbi:MAG: PilZ domain-containing protein [Vulcanococcus sp.]